MRRNVLVASILSGTMMSAAVGWIAGQSIQSPAQIAAKTAAPTPSLITVSVAQQQLSSDVIVRGVVRYGGVQQVSLVPSTLKSSADILTVPPAAGATLTEGKSAMSISGRPVFVLQGSTPVYRDLTPGSTGDDLRQLQLALARLGFDPGTTDGTYGPQTGAAVARFYTAAGFAPFGPTQSQRKTLRSDQAAVSQAKLAVLKANAALAKAAPQSRPLLRNEAALAQNDLSNAQATLADLSSKIGTSVPSDEVIFFPLLPLRVESVKLKGGDKVSGGVMKISTPRLAIDSSLALNDATLVRAGLPAQIEESNLGIRVTGKVTQVAPGPGTNGVDPQHVYLEVLPDQAPAQLVGASVKVTIPVKSTNGKVLVVPASAVFLGGDGKSRVQLDSHGTPVPVLVQPGLSAGGLVEIKPLDHSLGPGDRVVVGKH